MSLNPNHFPRPNPIAEFCFPCPPLLHPHCYAQLALPGTAGPICALANLPPKSAQMHFLAHLQRHWACTGDLCWPTEHSELRSVSTSIPFTGAAHKLLKGMGWGERKLSMLAKIQISSLHFSSALALNLSFPPLYIKQVVIANIGMGEK